MKPFLISIVTDVIDAPVALVYSIVTDNKNFQWRKEVKNIQKKENEYYAFTMQHKLFYGEWEGKFESYNGGTKVCFQEKIHIKNFFLRLIAPLFWNLKRIQQNYITALKAEVYANQ